MIKTTFVITLLNSNKIDLNNINTCLSSIEKQKNIEKEVIIVSNLEEQTNLKELINLSSFNYHIIFNNNKTSTLGSLRNTALNLASGVYICFINANDFLKQDSIYELTNKALETDSDILIGQIMYYNPKKHTYQYKSPVKTFTDQSLNVTSTPELLNYLDIFDKIFKVEFLRKNKLQFSDTLYFDYFYFEIIALLKASKISVLPIYFYNERQKLGLETVNNPLLEQKIDEQQVKDFTKVFFDIYNFQEKNELIDRNNTIVYIYINFIFKRGLNYLNILEDKYNILEEISKPLQVIDIENLKIKQRQKNILKFIKNGNFDEYLNFIKEEKVNKEKKKNLKVYTTYTLFKRLYSLASILPMKKKRVLFISHSPGMDGNYKFIYNAIQDYNSKALGSKKFTCKFTSTKVNLLEKILMPFKLARSEFILVAENIPFFQHLDFRKETKVVQTWHAAGAFKKFGFSTNYLEGGPNPFENKKMNIHKGYDYATVSSEDVRKHYSEAFDMNISNVIPIGFPRADFFFNESMVNETKQKIYDLYPELKNKKVILYAPTFRGFGKGRSNFNIEFDFNKIAKNISNEFIIALKLHPSVRTSNINIDPEVSSKVIDISSYSDANDILTITDLLITDYSSIIFDYSLLNKPMLFFAYDLDEYRFDRDFYYDYESFIPGPLAKTNDDIISLINKWDFDMQKVEKFCSKFFVSKDGKNSERFVNDVLVKLSKK